MNAALPNGPAVRKLLVCVAEGIASDHAIRAASQVAATTKASVDLLHVVEPLIAASGRFLSVTGGDLTATHAENVGVRLRAHLANEHRGLRLGGEPVEQRLEVVVGAPSRVVLERAKNYDMVFLGESGRRRQLDLGGLARALFAHCDVPLWMQVDPPRKIERILAPIDLSPKSMEVLRHAVGLARALSAQVTALHCFAPPEMFPTGDGMAPTAAPTYTIDSLREGEREHFESTMRAFDWLGVAHETEFAQDDAARRILARQDAFDLVVLGTHGHSALLASVLGSVAWRVLRMAHTGVLLVRTPGGYAL